MGRLAIHNNKGMTLIEVMIALLILMIVSLALMQTALLGMKENLRNAIRDEAVNVAEQKMNELRSSLTSTTTLPLGSQTEADIVRNFRASSLTFTPTRTVSQIGPDTQQVTMAVRWIYSGTTYTHSVTTIMRNQ